MSTHQTCYNLYPNNPFVQSVGDMRPANVLEIMFNQQYRLVLSSCFAILGGRFSAGLPFLRTACSLRGVLLSKIGLTVSTSERDFAT